MPMISFGTTRLVISLGSIALKFPKITKWTVFLRGILANIDERHWYRHSPPEWRLKLCPTLFSFAGLFLISKRAHPITEEEFSALDESFYYPLPLDVKRINFGRYQDRIVLVDYADVRYFCSDCEMIFKCMGKDVKMRRN